MNTISRRTLLAASAGLLTASSVFAQETPKVDFTDLLAAPEFGDMIIGSADAKVTMVEYGSASCPHCAAFHKDIFLKLKTDYIDKGILRFIFREFPHNNQGLAAFMVARCAPKEKYFPLLDVFFTTQQVWIPDAAKQLKNIAQQAGMSEADFDACLKNEKLAKDIIAVRDKGQQKYGVSGIPTIFLNGKTFGGETTYDAYKAEIDLLLIK